MKAQSKRFNLHSLYLLLSTWKDEIRFDKWHACQFLSLWRISLRRILCCLQSVSFERPKSSVLSDIKSMWYMYTYNMLNLQPNGKDIELVTLYLLDYGVEMGSRIPQAMVWKWSHFASLPAVEKVEVRDADAGFRLKWMATIWLLFNLIKPKRNQNQFFHGLQTTMCSIVPNRRITLNKRPDVLNGQKLTNLPVGINDPVCTTTFQVDLIFLCHHIYLPCVAKEWLHRK